MERSPTQMAVIVLSSLAALAAAFAWGFLGYKSEVYRAESMSIAQEVADASIQGDRNMALKASLGRARSSVMDVSDDFTLESQIPDFISILEGLARDRSVSLDIGAISLGGNPEDTSPRPLSLHLNGSCAWRDCVGFVSALDAMDSALEIRDMSLTGGGKAGAWKLSVDMIQYVIK